MPRSSAGEPVVSKCVLAAAAASLALEPLSWRGAGTVSRLRDHGDKRLTDYVAYSHRVPLVYNRVCEKEAKGCRAHRLFLKLVSDMKRTVATNLSLGTLLHLSLHLAPLSRGDPRGPRELSRSTLAENALAEAMSFPFMSFIEGFAMVSPRYAGRMRAWLFPDIFEPFPRPPARSLWWAARELSEFDPVLREVYEGWRVSRRLAEELSSRVGKGLPGSGDLDWLFTRACALLGSDYLAFRRLGAEAMEGEVRACAQGSLERVGTSLGSVADVVVMGVFYHLVENWFGEHCYMT